MNNEIINEDFVLEPIGSKREFNFDINEASIFPTKEAPIKFDVYCPGCKQNRDFACYDVINYPQPRNLYWNVRLNTTDYSIYRFSCGYDHKLTIVVKHEQLNEETCILVKVGQYPESLELMMDWNKDFLKELDAEHKKYYFQALKSSSNNLYIGSFNYLRRIFEKLVTDSIASAHANGQDIDQTKPLKDKVKFLINQKLLNEILGEGGFNVLYSLLSNGIHNSSEEECKNVYGLLNKAIEIILYDEVRLKKQLADKEEVSKMLNKENSQ